MKSGPKVHIILHERSNYQYANSNEEVQELEGKEGKKMKMKNQKKNLERIQIHRVQPGRVQVECDPTISAIHMLYS